MTLPASIRVNVRAPFPSRVQGSAFITVAKSSGVYTIAPNYTILGPSVGLSVTQVLALQDTVTKAFSYISASQLVAAAFSSYRVVTAIGSVAVQPTDVVILLQKGSSGASTINLPNSATRGGAPITVVDMTGDANTNNITFVPSLGETIQGLSAAASAANGLAVIDVDYGSKTMYPLAAGGWYTK